MDTVNLIILGSVFWVAALGIAIVNACNKKKLRALKDDTQAGECMARIKEVVKSGTSFYKMWYCKLEYCVGGQLYRISHRVEPEKCVEGSEISLRYLKKNPKKAGLDLDIWLDMAHTLDKVTAACFFAGLAAWIAVAVIVMR